METISEIPSDIEKYVRTVLSEEADDIPQKEIEAGKWVMGEIPLDEIKVDLEMIKRHDEDDLHINRRDNFINTIKQGKPILPLIVLGRQKYLVDGYARYRALKSLDIKIAKTIYQLFEN